MALIYNKGHIRILYLYEMHILFLELHTFTEYNASCQVKEQKDEFETISHDFRRSFDK